MNITSINEHTVNNRLLVCSEGYSQENIKLLSMPEHLLTSFVERNKLLLRICQMWWFTFIVFLIYEEILNVAISYGKQEYKLLFVLSFYRERFKSKLHDINMQIYSEKFVLLG